MPVKKEVSPEQKLALYKKVVLTNCAASQRLYSEEDIEKRPLIIRIDGAGATKPSITDNKVKRESRKEGSTDHTILAAGEPLEFSIFGNDQVEKKYNITEKIRTFTMPPANQGPWG